TGERSHGIARHRESGPHFVQAPRPFQHGDVPALPGQRDGGGQACNTGPCDDCVAAHPLVGSLEDLDTTLGATGIARRPPANVSIAPAKITTHGATDSTKEPVSA